MIYSKDNLKECLGIEKKKYFIWNKKDNFVNVLTSDMRLQCWKFIKALRKCEYYKNKKDNSLIHALMYLAWRKRKNLLGLKLNIDIWENSIGPGLQIFHPGNIVINGNARIGKNLKLHGSNCIGNDGVSTACPVLGDNVELGVGAIIIGGIKICSNVIIGAGAVVVRDIEIPGTYVGVPAKRISEEVPKR